MRTAMFQANFFRAGWPLLAAALVAGCGRGSSTGPEGAAEPPPGAKVFTVRGVIQAIRPNGVTADIQHEEIPGYMPAMTMPLTVKDPKELTAIQPGDRVTFRMIVTEDDGWIDRVTKIGVAPVKPPPPRREFRRVRAVEPLSVGDMMPDYPFTNELGRAVRLADFKGKAYAMTFIFTRCPYPLFCPKMNNNFKEAQRQLKARPDGPDNWHLLSISFDVEFDTPAVLRGYAKSLQYDPERWSFLTGELIEIDAITEQFGLVFPRSGNGIGIFDHNLRTVVVDAAGRVQHIFIGNEWTADQLVEELVKAAAAR